MLASPGRLAATSGRRPLTLLARAIAAIRRLGGTALYVPDDYGLVLGPELVTNGDFSDGLTGWSSTNTPAPQVVGGEYVITASGSEAYPGGTQIVTCVVGKRYRLTVTGRRGTTANPAAIYAAFAVGGSTVVAAGFNTTTVNTTYSTSFVADGNGAFTVTPHISGAPASVGTAYFDNISVREIISATSFIDSTGTQPVTAINDLVGLLTDRSYGAGNLGGELVTNGDFSAGATGWTLDTGWTVSGGAAVGTAVASLSLFQSCLTVGKFYKITFTITTVSAGDITPFCGLGTMFGNYGAAGTYSMVGQCLTNTNLYFRGNGFTGTIDNISVREVLGNHASQPTTASKPLVTRVPRKLGPELVTSGPVTLTAGSQQPITGSTIVSGRQYAITIPSGVLAAITSGWSVTGNGGQQIAAANGTGLAQVYSAAGAGPFTPSIKEVLEWSNALDFDGSNDLLTLSSGAILQQGSDHFVTAAFVLDAVGAEQCIYAATPTSGLSRVAHLNITSANALRCLWIDNASASATVQGATLVAGVPYVVTAARVGSTYSLWLNGVLVQSTTVTLGATTVTQAYLGTLYYSSAQFLLNGKLIDIVIDQGTLTEADRILIETNMALRARAQYAVSTPTLSLDFTTGSYSVSDGEI